MKESVSPSQILSSRCRFTLCLSTRAIPSQLESRSPLLSSCIHLSCLKSQMQSSWSELAGVSDLKTKEAETKIILESRSDRDAYSATLSFTLNILKRISSPSFSFTAKQLCSILLNDWRRRESAATLIGCDAQEMCRCWGRCTLHRQVQYATRSQWWVILWRSKFALYT